MEMTATKHFSKTAYYRDKSCQVQVKGNEVHRIQLKPHCRMKLS